MGLLYIGIFAALGFAFTFPLVRLLIRFQKLFGCRRAPEFHHTHTVPVPRLGGLALAVSFVLLEILIASFLPREQAQIRGGFTVILSSLAIFALGFWDDLSPLSAGTRLLGQVLIAVWVHLAGLGVEAITVPFANHTLQLHGWGVIFTVLWLVGNTNLMNLIDGTDGLAGGIGFILMCMLVYVGCQSGTFSLLAAGVAGSLLAFLAHNLKPARIYLGDGGAYLLGYLIGIFSLVSSHKGAILAFLLAPLFLLMLHIVDTAFTIIRRALRGLPLFRPDKGHFHHRLLARGMPQPRVLMWNYAVTLVPLLLWLAASSRREYLVAALGGLTTVTIAACASVLGPPRQWLTTVNWALFHSSRTRQETHYAISLLRWVRLEAVRCASVTELYDQVELAAKRLGFTGLKLELADGARNWDSLHHCEHMHSIELHSNGAGTGTLRFKAPACMRAEQCHKRKAGVQPFCKTRFDSQHFRTMCELVAETWNHATTQYAPNREGPLRFDTAPEELSLDTHRNEPQPRRKKE